MENNCDTTTLAGDTLAGDKTGILSDTLAGDTLAGDKTGILSDTLAGDKTGILLDTTVNNYVQHGVYKFEYDGKSPNIYSSDIDTCDSLIFNYNNSNNNV